MSERYVNTKWGDTIRMNVVGTRNDPAIACEIIGPRGGNHGYIVLEEKHGRDLLSALAISLAEMDALRGQAAA